jgi:lysozyme family protein
MADVNQAIEFVLPQEVSAKDPGAITNISGDRGGMTRYGLASRWHPELVAKNFYDRLKMPDAVAEPLALATYACAYAAPLLLSEIDDQDVANRVLSFAVNEGQCEAVGILQAACAACGEPLNIDDRIGPATIAAVNAINPAALLAALRSREEAFYEHLAASNPSDEKFLAGWEHRAEE